MLKIMWFNLNQGRGVIYNSVSGWSLLLCFISMLHALCKVNLEYSIEMKGCLVIGVKPVIQPIRAKNILIDLVVF